ncbi:phosphatase PAP2 family protein [Paenibacillus sp. KS-LC4]|uniref:phosphatase PAP2 family protein n=1 Tax=Paenibacillus sp. KS-LC4 TaxID=2979727 RepID=UPI0030D0CCE4
MATIRDNKEVVGISISKLNLLAVVCFVLFILIGLTFQTPFVKMMDQWLIHYIQAFEAPSWTSIMKFLSFIGSVNVVIISSVPIILFLLFVWKSRRETLLFLIAVFGSALLNAGLKLLFQRARPSLNAIITEVGYSFPSGHSMNAFTFYGILTYLCWRHIPSEQARKWLLAFSSIMIVGIGLSRIYLGVHYPSDVVGAYLISLVWLIAVIQCTRYFTRVQAA